MGYQPRTKTPRGSNEYNKPLRERRKDRKDNQKRAKKEKTKEIEEVATEEELTQTTLKRLRTLGMQKFGSSPYFEHFNRWLANVSAVLGEFEAYPSIKVDKAYMRERDQALSLIKSQFEFMHKKEATIDRELENLALFRSALKQINADYTSAMQFFGHQKNREVRHLQGSIDSIKKEQDEIIRVKTGLLRGISRREREEKELKILEVLTEKQEELEIVLTKFNDKKISLREEYESRKEPVLKQISDFKRKIQQLETDASLEERWFACESLIDAIIGFLQRKSIERI
jgi:hypothetical protein